DSRRNNRRIVNYVTVIATQKLDDKDKQVGIFFDRNRLIYFTGPEKLHTQTLFDLDRTAYFLDLLLDVFCFFLGNGFLYGRRRAFHKILGFFETQ
ncbi:MAG: hypothetical protein BECKG1743F_GA0114225_101379, partial [Candidatus Kentron sp. G]